MSEFQNSNVHTGEEDEDILSSQTFDVEDKNLLVDTTIEVSNNSSKGVSD